MKEVASLKYGVIFRKTFSDPEIFTAFVRDFLGIDIEIEKVETEKSFDPPIGKVASRFDLYAEDKKNRIIVDIQHERLFDHYDRFLHYHCAAILEQAATCKGYYPELKVCPFSVKLILSIYEKGHFGIIQRLSFKFVWLYSSSRIIRFVG